MSHPRPLASLISAAAMLFAVNGWALAQPASAPGAPSPRKWDGQVGFGTSGSKNHIADPSVPAAEVGIEVGRYWSNHVKTAITLTNAGGTTYPSYSLFPEGFIATRLSSRRAVTVSGVVAYQFGTNLFVHPYLTAGARMAWLTETRDRYATDLPYYYTASTPGSEIRPLVGGGFKAYFANGLVFVRPEYMVVIGTDRPTHSTLRLMIGRDF